jgi:hypothetical protein
MSFKKFSAAQVSQEKTKADDKPKEVPAKDQPDSNPAEATPTNKS